LTEIKNTSIAQQNKQGSYIELNKSLSENAGEENGGLLYEKGLSCSRFNADYYS